MNKKTFNIFLLGMTVAIGVLLLMGTKLNSEANPNLYQLLRGPLGLNGQETVFRINCQTGDTEYVDFLEVNGKRYYPVWNPVSENEDILGLIDLINKQKK